MKTKMKPEDIIDSLVERMGEAMVTTDFTKVKANG